MRDSYFKLRFCLWKDVSDVNLHCDPIIILKKNFGKALIAHCLRLLEEFHICDIVCSENHRVTHYLELIEFKINDLILSET